MTPEQKALDEIYERLCRLERQLGSQMTPADARELTPAIEACKWRKQPEHGQRYGHLGQLREIFDGVLRIEQPTDTLLSTNFPDGSTRLSFLCGEDGRLLGVVIQRDKEPAMGTTAIMRPPEEPAAQEPFVVWARDRGGWWGPKARGYTPNFYEAGVFVSSKTLNLTDNDEVRPLTKELEKYLRISDSPPGKDTGDSVASHLALERERMAYALDEANARIVAARYRDSSPGRLPREDVTEET